MYSKINTAVLQGVESVSVCVEADVSDGFPQFEMVGFLSSEVKEARERVRTAIRNSGFHLSAKKITVNLTPADVRKSGNCCDLPVAAAILSAYGFLDDRLLLDYLLLGEVGLNGDILPVNGILNAAILAIHSRRTGIIVPWENRREAALFRELRVLPVKTIRELVDLCCASLPDESFYNEENPVQEAEYSADFREVCGQQMVRRAMEIAAAGMHNLLIVGPPGAGKSMLAKRMPTILPPLKREEKLEVSQIYSACGLLDDTRILMQERPFRAPHHTISVQALAGGGTNPRPGEVSLAHKGVLFLDEMAEFPKSALDTLREPLEDGRIRISRTAGSYEFPAEILLLGAANPCSCGYWPDRRRCTCSARMITRYSQKFSGPLLDRFDLCVKAEEVRYQDLQSGEVPEDSASIRERVVRAHQIQNQRYANKNYLFNSRIPSSDIDEFCAPDDSMSADIERLYEEYGLSARSYYKVLRVARTIADLEGAAEIEWPHFLEAVQFRAISRNYWELK